MSITIELPPHVERKLRAVADDPEAVRRVMIEESAALTSVALEALEHSPVSLPPTERLTTEEFKALTDKLVAIMDRHPNTPNGTYTREEIYEDHPKW